MNMNVLKIHWMNKDLKRKTKRSSLPETRTEIKIKSDNQKVLPIRKLQQVNCLKILRFNYFIQMALRKKQNTTNSYRYESRKSKICRKIN